MQKEAYYNENNPFAAAWLREVIKAGLIAPGFVDERSIEDVRPKELAGYRQHHFFAGIGVWSYALRLAGWPDERPVWTGSCPCQPFSAAGKGKGFADERHLWPAWFHLVGVCRPGTIFGEQVASKHGLAWLDLVQTDLENANYACGAVDTCSAGFGAPHIRQRLYWLADAASGRRQQFQSQQSARICCPPLGPEKQVQQPVADGSGVLRLGDAISTGLEGYTGHDKGSGGRQESDRPTPETGTHDYPGPVNGFWADADWLRCKDDKWRPVEPGTFPLADGAAARVGRLRGYGNAINAIQAAEFIRAAMDILDGYRA